jgi:hypothetical protein
MITGYTNELPDDCLLDTGVLFVGASPFGASSGGLGFDPGITRKQIEFDGRRSDIAGNDRTIMFAPKITGKFLQFNAAQIVQLEPDVTSASATGVMTFTPKEAGILDSQRAYIPELRLFFERAGSTESAPLYAAVYFPKALVDKYKPTGKDKSEVEIDCEFAARLDMSVNGTKITDPPYKIELRSTLPT